MKEYLRSTYHLNFDNKEFTEFVKNNINESLGEIENIIKLYLAIRDGFWYNPYQIDLRKKEMTVSKLIKKKNGNCIEKACVLVAAARSINIPSRLHLMDVRNHIATEKLEEALGSNLLVCHGYAELYIDGKWVAATPAFNKELCKKINVDVLDFNGKNDSVFQQYDKESQLFMKYEKDHGYFADLPLDYIIEQLKNAYPQFLNNIPMKGLKFFLDD